MLSQKILQGLFRALDLADEVRATIDRMRGKPPAGAAWETVPPPSSSPLSSARGGPANTDTESGDANPNWQSYVRDTASPLAETKPARRRTGEAAAHKKAKPAPRAKKKAAAAAPARGEPKNDLQAILDVVGRGEFPTLTDALEVDGRSMLGRMVWALAAAEKVLGHGLSGPDVADLVGRLGIVTAPNNVMRAIRLDGGRLFEKGSGTGRALVLGLTEEGRAQARKLGL